MAEVVLVADDLSGAVETAATFLSRKSRILVVLDTEAVRPDRPDVDVLAFDTNGRQLDASAAATRTAAALSAAGSSVALKKIDSLLRGHLATELIAAHIVRPNLVVAPALPAAGRTLRDGVVQVDGRPLHETDAWHAESQAPPRSVASVLAGMATTVLPLATVRSDRLAATVSATLAAGIVPICDADSDADLDRIVAATARIEQLVLVGSAGLAAALARSLPVQSGAGSRPGPAGAARVLVVVGSAARPIAAQLDALTALDHELVLAQPDDLAGDRARSAQLAARICGSTGSVVVVAVDPRAAVDPGRSRRIALEFSSAVAGAARDFGGLLLTGGETARAVLDHLEITRLEPLFQVHHGAVVCAAPDGQLIATRPGSFGDRYSLLSIVRALQTGVPPTKESS